jgi:2-oxoglutarate dehydrogenase E2 component (dihydrolipoamide succinyltransferase)
MLLEVKVPQLSESVSEATLLSWHKKVGEAVKRDENLIDVETDKVVLELPAPADGVLTKILKDDGGAVVAGEVIAQIDTEAKPATGAPAGVRPEPATVAPTPGPSAETARTDPRLMPSARKVVEEQGVDPTAIAGSGRDGRITKADVLEQIGRSAPAAGPSASPPVSPSVSSAVSTPAPAPSPAPAVAKPTLPPVSAPVATEDSGVARSEQRVPMSRLRARVAERLVQAQQTAAILTTFNEVNMQAVIDLRSRYRERFEKEHGVRLGFMSFFVKAVVHALRKYPVLNASVDGNDIVYHGYFDIGIAVSSPRGLVVPILRGADQLPLAEIEKRIAEFGKRAQDGKLGIEELTGGTFSISNGGVFGSMLSTPIINPPQSAILGVHATKDRPVVENGQVVVRPMNYLALSYDHRIIDGREAVLGLVAIKESLEDPARLLLDL